MSARARFVAVARAPHASTGGLTVCLDAAGYAWVLDSSTRRWVRWAPPALPVRPLFRSIAISAGAPSGPWVVAAVDTLGRVFCRQLGAFGWGPPSSWSAWTEMPSERQADDENSNPTEAP